MSFTPEHARDRLRAIAMPDLAALAGRPPAGDHLLNPGLAWGEEARLKDAAVLIPVVLRQPEVTVLMTTRTAHLSSHAGQVAFPGGRVDPDDASPIAAALREADEEIGLAADLVEPLGYLDLYLSNSGYRIAPVLALVRPGFTLTPNPQEVENTFEVPLAFLMNPANHHMTSRFWKGLDRHYYEMPYDGHRIWGVTAGIIRRFWERLHAGAAGAAGRP